MIWKALGITKIVETKYSPSYIFGGRASICPKLNWQSSSPAASRLDRHVQNPYYVFLELSRRQATRCIGEEYAFVSGSYAPCLSGLGPRALGDSGVET